VDVEDRDVGECLFQVAGEMVRGHCRYSLFGASGGAARAAPRTV
jgi:hypothetical protein